MFEYLLLFFAAYAAAAISGAAGFGGALLLLPMLVTTVGVTQAVPLLTVAQLIGNLSRAGFGFSEIAWRPVALFLAGAVPFSVLGALSFVQFSSVLVTRAIGVAIMVFVFLKYFDLLKIKSGRVWLISGGCVVGYLSGVLGSAGPLGAAIFLTLGLPPVAYIASEATTALVMHGVKGLIYQHYIVLDQRFWGMAGLMGLAMITGTWTAKQFVERIPHETFHRWVALILVTLATYMLIHG